MPGYKQTEIGVLPDSWDTITFEECFTILPNNTLSRAELNYNGGEVQNIHYGDILVKFPAVLDCSTEGLPYINKENVSKASKGFLRDGDLIMADTAEDVIVGKSTEVIGIGDSKIVSGLHTIPCRPMDAEMFAPKWLGYFINHCTYHDQLIPYITGIKVSSVSKSAISSTVIAVPPKPEQEAIAEALTDIDTLIVNLEKLIAKKKAIKQGAMQELLTGKRRLPGFDGEWKTKAISDIAIILDDHRIPVKESDREKMEGDIPYCGANGVLGYVNDYTIDGDIILIAEDGGYFDEYATRPIAYKMAGKCWVNNHAHILQSKSNTNQDYLFYGLVHKDIRDFITSGTRSKLNKSELLKIIVALPVDFNEQTAIASILTDMDNEITVLKNRLFKLQNIKTGMMSELLTGRIRLIDKGDA